MENIFLSILNMSITAGWIVLAVVLLRLIMKKAPRWIMCLLWILVGIRLVCPFSVESVLSLIPSSEPIPQEVIYYNIPTPSGNSNEAADIDNIIIHNTNVPEAMSSMTNTQVILVIACAVWVAGIIGMLIYSAVSFLRIRHKVSASINTQNNIYICDNIDTPFILGFIKPRIYLPSHLSTEEAEYVIAHEKAHIKRKDYIWKPLGFLLLSIHWFNPLLWLGYVLLSRDIELACDEKVIREKGTECKKDYSSALLSCSVPRKMISACPLAFGEVGVKQRIKSILNYKKPAFWVSIVAIVICIAVAVGFLTNPITRNPYGFEVQASGSDIAGVSIDITDIAFAGENDNENGYIEIKWINENEENYTCGESFSLYKKVDSAWVGCRVGSSTFVSVGYIVPSKGDFTHQYSLWSTRISEPGTYKFESTFHRNGGETIPISHNAWVEFTIDEVPDSAKAPTTFEGVTAEITSVDLDDNHTPYIEVKWTNKTDKAMVTGEHFELYRMVGGNPEDCRVSYGYTSDVGLIIPPNNYINHTYNLSDYDIGINGTYRFVGYFSEDRLNSPNHYAYIDFGINDLWADRVMYQFEADKLVYDCSAFSYSRQPEDTPSYRLTENLILLEQKDTGEPWKDIGEMQKITLDSEHFHSRFLVDKDWTEGYSLKGIRDNNKLAYEYTDSSHAFQILRQKDNSFYLVVCNIGDGNPFVRWIYKLNTVTLTGGDIIDEGQNYYFYYTDSEDPIKPQLILSQTGNRFQFMISGLSSYLPQGTYSIDNNMLTLTADDGNEYVFRYTDTSTIEFVANESAVLPKYRYSPDEPAKRPIPDGAKFEFDTTKYSNDTLAQNVEQSKAVIYEYFSALKAHDVNRIDACLSEELKYKNKDSEAVDAFITPVTDCKIINTAVTYKGYDTVRILVEYEITYNEDYLPVGTRQAGYNLIKEEFTLERENNTMLITLM